MAPTDEEAQRVAEHVLTRRMTPHLDRHLVFPILDFLRNTEIYTEEDICKAEIELLLDTNMIDFVVEKYEKIGEKPPPSLETRRQEVLDLLVESRDKVLKMLEILEDEEKLAEVRSIKSLSAICERFDLASNIFDELFRYARLQFDCGNYQLSGVLLRHYQSITAQDQEQVATWRTPACTWGILAIDIVEAKVDQAVDIFLKIDEYLESARLTKREVLAQRTWLLHWALFAIFTGNAKEIGGGKVLDLFLTDKSMMIMNISCPHLFRYVAAGLVLHKRLKHMIKDTVRIIGHETSTYSDPVTRFLYALYIDVDFDEAQRELKECASVFKGDFFLASFWGEFEENARLLIFETYCRIHQCINIAMIATKLNMEAPEAELWIVKLIQNAKLDARIDSEKSRVVMTKAPPSVHQQVIDKTKDLSFRSTMLLSHLEKREAEKAEAMNTR
eukprot:TRINITY_DN1276_c0_g2_i1.p1 TRINITY_DN1276_c0_g2~~TRINITY_DN1276_c0_g2_i1.p1  ORF type:complete len:445 (-),score=145.43 TRINITY_DN1276_c0_g2_i1:116-1450(-)